MSDTPNLGLPYLDAAQAQKHVTVNEGLRRLDALAQLAVEARTLAAPPPSPAEGQRWIVGPAATGAWAGRSGAIAAWQDGGWSVFAPKRGWLAVVIAEPALVMWTGAVWAKLA